MAKAAKTFCDRCDARMIAGAPFCGSCGYPTTWATHDERTAWEVAQYREKSLSAPISGPAQDAPARRAAARVEVTEPARRSIEKRTFGGLFSRRRSQPTTLVLPEPKRVEPPVTKEAEAPAGAVLTMVRPEPAPQPAPRVKAPAPAAPKPQALETKPAPRVRAPKIEQPAPSKPKASGSLVSKVERAMNDRDQLVDTPATVLAMRMLNQRVRELDEKVQKLERELSARAAVEPPKPRKRFGR